MRGKDLTLDLIQIDFSKTREKRLQMMVDYLHTNLLVSQEQERVIKAYIAEFKSYVEGGKSEERPPIPTEAQKESLGKHSKWVKI